MLTFIKLGGSLITDKRESQHFHAEVMRRVAQEIVQARTAQPDLKLLIGHGSGSFGHVAAQKHGTMNGVHTAQEWCGFAEVATVARRLNSLVVEALYEAGLPVFAVQPSSSAQCDNGKIVAMETAPITGALDHDLIPLVYGDVAFDSARGGTIIATETIFGYLAERLRPARIMLLGEVEGVYDYNGVIIPHIHPQNYEATATALRGSHGTDVTGGMASKVRQMLELVALVPGLEVRIFGGTIPGQIVDTLTGQIMPGTLITGNR
ncbi:MAG: isopentenyl phosphate kinase family protein [Anaerolineae bacterium]|nr:isopentenyl phosphate kinase family protein [Anaerolineae bacterium]